MQCFKSKFRKFTGCASIDFAHKVSCSADKDVAAQHWHATDAKIRDNVYRYFGDAFTVHTIGFKEFLDHRSSLKHEMLAGLAREIEMGPMRIVSPYLLNNSHVFASKADTSMSSPFTS